MLPDLVSLSLFLRAVDARSLPAEWKNAMVKAFYQETGFDPNR